MNTSACHVPSNMSPCHIRSCHLQAQSNYDFRVVSLSRTMLFCNPRCRWMSMPTQVSEELPTLCRNQLPTNLGECLDSDNRGRFFWAQTGKPRTLIHSFIRKHNVAVDARHETTRSLRLSVTMTSEWFLSLSRAQQGDRLRQLQPQAQGNPTIPNATLCGSSCQVTPTHLLVELGSLRLRRLVGNYVCLTTLEREWASTNQQATCTGRTPETPIAGPSSRSS